MAINKARGAIRGGRRAHSKRLIITPAKTRRGLMLGTAMVGGSLATFAAALAKPRPRPRWLKAGGAIAAGMLATVITPAASAWAACTYTSPTAICSNTGNGEFNPTISGTVNVQVTVSAGTGLSAAGSGTIGAINIDASGQYGNKIDAALDANGDHVTSITATAGIGVQLRSGRNASIDVSNIDPDVTITSTNDALRLRTGSDGDSTGYAGTITLHSSGVLESTTNGQGIDAKAGSGGVELNIDGGSVTSDKSQGIVAEAGNGGKVAINIADGAEVYGAKTGLTGTAYGAVFGLITTGSTGEISVDNAGGVTGGNTGGTPATQAGVYAQTNSSGSVTITNESSGSISATGAGVYVADTGSGSASIDVSNHRDEDTYGSIIGSTGVSVTGNNANDITLTNYGHIEGTDGQGSNLSNADNISVTNHSLGSMIGSTVGQEISYANSTSYDNQGGLTAGLTGNGLSIHNINGVTIDAPEYSVSVDNTTQHHGASGGIIIGNGSGVSMYGIDTSVSYVAGENGVLVDNSGGGWGYWKKPGGLIVGETGNGVEITGTTGDVTIDNSDTRNGATNDLSTSAIDSQVGYDGLSSDSDPVGTTLLDKLVSGTSPTLTYGLNYVLSGTYAPTAPSDGISTGIWGYGSGIYEQNIAGTVTVDNSKGQIFGKTADGIELWDVGTGVTGDVNQTVVDIDNSRGLVEGGTNGANLQGIQNGSLYYDNQSGVTLGGTNGIYIGIGSVTDLLAVAGNVTIQNEDGLIGGGTGDGISINQVGGDVDISNENAWWRGDGGTIVGGTEGLQASNIGGSFWLDNERGLTLGLDGDGVDVLTVGGTASVDNSGGVIAGLTDVGAKGVSIDSTGGIGANYGDLTGLTYSVVVQNTAVDHGHQGGIIAGNEDGVYIHNVTTASGDTSEVDPVVDAGILIDNSGSTSWNHHHLTQTPGGLIVGITGDGIHIDGVTKGTGGTGGVTIDNSYTRDNGSNNITSDGWGSIDTDVASAIDGPLDDAVGDDFLRVAAQTTGIWGLDGSGISGVSIGGEFYVDNVKGQIVGSDDSGILLSGVGGQLQRTVDINGNVTDDAVYIDNSNGGGDSWWARRSAGGLITGGDYGIRLTNINNGNVILDNTKGTVYGDEMAFALGGDGTAANQGLNGGDVYIYNSGGLIEGHNGTSSVFGGTPPGADSLGAITINNVQGIEGAGGHVYISNGNEDGEDGGSILGISTASAISIGSYLDPETGAISANANTAVDTADIYNGSPHNIWSFYEGDSDGPITGGLIAGTGGANTPVILLNTSSTYVNDGENEANGYIYNNGVIASTNIEDFVDPDSDGNPQTDLRDFLTDAYGAGNYVESNGYDSDLGIDGLQTALQNVDNNGAATDNLIQSSVGAAWIENTGVLLGTVNLTGSNSYYTGEEEDTATAGNEIDNYSAWFTRGTNTVGGADGAINNEGLIQTAFGNETPTTTTFDVANFNNDTPTYYSGYLSSLDGVSGNTTIITGNFNGGSLEGESEDGVYSVVALDAYLDIPEGDDGTPSADLLRINGSASGTTALIINNLNPNALTEMNTDGIEVVQVDNPVGGGCADVACKDGDTFYISSASTNYLNINGHGTLQQGLYAWYLTERPDSPAEGEDGYYLATAALPTADQTADLITGFENIFYAGTDLVSDHLYGGHFPTTGAGGGGADVTPQGPGQNATNAALWARASGSWTNENSTVDSSNLGSFDTGFNQDTYTLLGGVDMSPDGGKSGFRLGAFGGYVQSNLDFDNYGTTGKYTGGEVGGYAAYTQGGFYADAQVDGDFMKVHFDAPLGTGTSIDTNGTTIGVLANLGDRMYSGKNFFEPLASFAYANMTLDDQNVAGAHVDFSNGESLRGGVGARIGTTQTGKGGTVMEYTLLGRLWNEFSGDNTVTITDGTNTDTFTSDTSGLYGEVNGTVTLADTKTNLSTYLSGGLLFGSDSTTWNAKAGIRKEF